MKAIIKTLSILTILFVLSATLLAQTFTKITTGPVVNDGIGSTGGSWADYDNDGDLDLFVPSGGSANNSLYRNDGTEFTKITSSAIVNDVKSASALGNSWGDYDGDGDPDLFVSTNSGINNFLYRNDGTGNFTKITNGDIVNDGGFSVGSSWVDYDNDGDLDLWVDNEGDVNEPGHNNFLYRNDGTGSFTKITSGGIVNDGGHSVHSSWGDYDNDGDPDLFVPNQYGENNFLYRNDGNGTFTRITTGDIVNDGGDSKACSWADYDNDGDLDLFVANADPALGENNFLYRNDGNGNFTKIIAGNIVNDGGQSRGNGWADIDNDGDLDLFVANRGTENNNFLYRNDGEGTFTRILTGVVVNDGSASLGSCWGDYNNDGFLDLFVAIRGGDNNNLLYQNDGNSNRWINILCVGTVSSTTAIGAKVRVKATISGTPVWQLRDIAGQRGYASQNSLNAEFGLSDATIIDSLKIEWPSGIVEEYANIAVDQFMTATENGGITETPQGRVYVVTNTDDSGIGSLRQAIIDANDSAGTDTIAFDISSAGPHTIQPASALPTITDPVVIDGTTEPDFAGMPVIELDGSNAGAGVDGFRISAGNSTIRGLVINRFGFNGILLRTKGSNIIQGNFIGTDVTGMAAQGNLNYGIFIGSEADSNLIGGATASDRNIISGNNWYGVWLNESSHNRISGNYIGTDVNGTAAVANLKAGIMLWFDSQFNTIGGTTAGERNIISGNGTRGVRFNGGSNNTVSGNYIGTDVSGTIALGNLEHGITISEPGEFNIIGGTTEGERNIISGNGNSGIAMWNPGTKNNMVLGNYIGTDVAGTVALGGQSWAGVFIVDEANSNTIGGTTTGARNVISGNSGSGITISDSGTTENIVLGNFIGTDVTGTANLGNELSGVYIERAPGNVIGGTSGNVRNIIAGNLQGIRIEFEGANENKVLGNFIGTDVSGMYAIPNVSDGIAIRRGASNNIVGGAETGSGNLISGNGRLGISIGLWGANGNIVQGNYIGTDATGEGALGNQSSGISIFLEATDNLIGGEKDGAGNVIAHNLAVGVLLDNPSLTVRNRISRNSIFSNGEIGIDLSLETTEPWSDGITANDPGDADTGPNNLQNFPEITLAGINGDGDLVIEYSVDSDPSNSDYPLTIEFFASDTSGEGMLFLGSGAYAESDFSQGGKTVSLGSAASLEIVVGDSIVATAIDSSGNTSEFSAIAVVETITLVAESGESIPSVFALHQNYPNPFNPSTTIEFALAGRAAVQLKVFDITGREVATLVDEALTPGSYKVVFEPISLPGGVYFYRIAAGEFVQTKRLLLLK